MWSTLSSEKISAFSLLCFIVSSDLIHSTHLTHYVSFENSLILDELGRKHFFKVKKIKISRHGMCDLFDSTNLTSVGRLKHRLLVSLQYLLDVIMCVVKGMNKEFLVS